MKALLTTSNGNKNKTWLKNRIKSGVVELFETNTNNDFGYTKVSPEEAERMWNGLHFYEGSNGVIVGWLGTSFYYKLTIN